MYYRVIPSTKSPGIGNGLTYESEVSFQSGDLVSIPLRGKLIEGIVSSVIEKHDDQSFDVKSISTKLAPSSLLTSAQVQTALWMSEYYMCSVRKTLSPFLPGSDWSEYTKTETISELRWIGDSDVVVKGKKQVRIREFLESKDWVSENGLKTECDVSSTQIKRLIELGYIERRSQELKIEGIDPVFSKINLTDEQKTAYEIIQQSDKPTLLFGITGSGKTEVYASLIRDTIEQGKQAILLVPEILLAEHIVKRFEKFLGGFDCISIWHSHLTPAQKKKEWRRIHSGAVKLVIGSRSALFTPVQNLGLIVIDEEHEWTYKNEQTPRYHVRETAEKLCEYSGAKLVFGTATPSLESWSKVQGEKYSLARLDNRYGDSSLPTVRVVDLGELNSSDTYPFSQPLITSIHDRLNRGEQSVLFLNRRGVGSALLCLDCRKRVVSSASNMPFTVHEDRNGSFLLDHSSGLRSVIPEVCPNCSSSRLHIVGAGTKLVENALSKLFPKARVLRADKDSLSHPSEIQSLLHSMESGEADILIGTQSVVKGLDLPNVTLAAVLVADIGMSLPHFRATERSFQLLTQLTGRSGRAKPGEVIIQTFRPQCPEIQFAAAHNTEGFLEMESNCRKVAKYPPELSMIRLIVRGPTAKKDAQLLQQDLINAAGHESAKQFIHATECLFSGGREWQVLLRGNNPRDLLSKVSLQNAIVDIDPVNLL